jgi:hypothetical protein
MNKDMKCRDFQYEVGKTYECENAIFGHSGFHFCLRPFDVFKHYHPSQHSRYFKVESESVDITINHGFLTFGISDRCTRKITIVEELTLDDMTSHESEYMIDYIMKRIETQSKHKFLDTHSVMVAPDNSVLVFIPDICPHYKPTLYILSDDEKFKDIMDPIEEFDDNVRFIYIKDPETAAELRRKVNESSRKVRKV